MPAIKSSADLRNNYNEISTFCHNYPEPVFITKNGKATLLLWALKPTKNWPAALNFTARLKKEWTILPQAIQDHFPKLWLISGAAAVDELSGSYHFHRRTRYYACCGLHRIYPQNPNAADNLLDAATEQIGSLADLPQKFHLVDDPVLASWGIRFVIINNYLAFYTIDEEKQTVIIVRFLYQKSNWTAILRQGFSLI